MGLHLNWLAAPGVDKKTLIDRLGFETCGWAGDELNSAFACAVLPSGWVLIVSNEFTLDLDRLLPLASQGGFALGAEVSERAMFSSLKAWLDGRAAWAVTHDPNQDLRIEGEPPGEIAEIRRQLAALEATETDGQVDYMFDAPVELAKMLCGYDANGRIALEWSILRPAAGRRPAPAARRRTLYDALTAELFPLMGERGWAFDAALPDWRLARVQDGRLQALWFTWKDDGREIYFQPDFGAWPGLTQNVEPMVMGDIRRVRPRLSFGARLAAGIKALASNQTLDERTEEVVVRATRDLLSVDRFLTTGEADEGLRFRYGSVEAWRDALQQK